MMSETTRKNVMLLGASGTIGSATLAALVAQGHQVTCLVRPGTRIAASPGTVRVRPCDFANAQAIIADGFCGETFDIVLSCMASRSGVPDDAWAVDYLAHVDVLAAAKQAGVRQFILVSAICVQRPRLAFHQAKLAFEQALQGSGLTYSIVRPTAFFKSLSGQVDRVRRGKPFLLFGDGALTACKPISDADLAVYLVACIDDARLHNRILPIGGPGAAMTPRQQGEMLFALLDIKPRFRSVPAAMLPVIARALQLVGLAIPAAARKAELARIGHFYATESMLVWDPEKARYDADATPSTGADTLRDHYQRMIAGDIAVARGDHAVF